MISRLYLKDLHSFREVELEFVPGLVVLTGPSGAGKSLLMQAILANLGIGAPEARLSEIEMTRPAGLRSEEYELDETIALKAIRRERATHYLEGQKISRKKLRELLAPYVRYLSVRDSKGLESGALLEMLDRSRASRERSYKKLLREYRKRFGTFQAKSRELACLEAEERERAEQLEFARYEVEKIDAIAPKDGEYEELLRIKQQLSRIDKIREAMERASAIFEMEEPVHELFTLADREADYFSDAMNQLRVDFEEIEVLSDELAEVDIEGVLERLEQLSGLIRRYGSIPEALAYREEKAAELERGERVEEDRSALRTYLELEGRELAVLAARLSEERRKEALEVEKRLRPYLEKLRLPALSFSFDRVEMGAEGIDRIGLDLSGAGAEALSGGEFNRLRLALMTVTMEGGSGGGEVIFLDEIDANVSGDESIAIAEMIERLAGSYQIFAISHQPHLSARADQHILVRKEEGESVARSLEEEGRVREISRIVGGERPDVEALAFAEKLRKG
ncbi:AAA family ATPase [Nitratifractor sp.]